jgi:hypothetical protein
LLSRNGTSIGSASSLPPLNASRTNLACTRSTFAAK